MRQPGRLYVSVAIIALLCLGQALTAPTSVSPPDDKIAPVVTETLSVTTGAVVAANNSQSDNRKIESENKFVSEPTTSGSTDDGVAKGNEAEKVKAIAEVTTTGGVPSTKRPRKTMKLKRPRTSMATLATTVKPALPTDDYFISGLSDLLLENQAFDRIDDLLNESVTTDTPPVVTTTAETKAVTPTIVDDTTEVVEQQRHDHSTTDKPIEDVEIREPSTTTLSTIETTLSPITATTPEIETTTTTPPPPASTEAPTTTTTHETIATEKTINVSGGGDGGSADEHTTIDNRNIVDEQLFRQLKHEEDEKLNVKTKASNNTKKKALKQTGGVGGVGGGKGQNKKQKMSKKLAMVEETIGEFCFNWIEYIWNLD
jgi:hypothetical protein